MNKKSQLVTRWSRIRQYIDVNKIHKIRSVCGDLFPSSFKFPRDPPKLLLLYTLSPLSDGQDESYDFHFTLLVTPGTHYTTTRQCVIPVPPWWPWRGYWQPSIDGGNGTSPGYVVQLTSQPQLVKLFIFIHIKSQWGVRGGRQKVSVLWKTKLNLGCRCYSVVHLYK